MKNIKFLILLLFCFETELSLCQSVTSTGKWNFKVATSDIIDAGLDYNEIYESSAQKVRIEISNGIWKEYVGYDWTVNIKKVDDNWDSSLKIYARRTDDGKPANNSYETYVIGGESYIEITDFSTYFFSGLRGSTKIKIQFKVEGVSVLIPVDTYTTNIVYTVTSP
ncbi:hypothetical protein [Labilibaculum sp. K2S]|uniref:hypothetical protein n=1 Tax=Labilibaculum sp. K2S TaxID=3056386 RepID=UPI0025A466E0|nr:hypothetical protein [Labilibaculum sp. K2S]